MPRSIPFWLPQLNARESVFIREVLDSNFLNDGEFTTRFEKRLAELVGTRHVVAVTSGTAAIFLALAACGVGHGDEVIVPDVTFIATANAVTMTGATPVLVDCDPKTLNIDPQAIERAITSRTKAIVPVHVSGRPADMDAIGAIASRLGLIVIEDAAEALLSRYNGRCLGAIGRAGCVSFSPNKTVSTGQGGAIFTDDEVLYFRLRELKDQGRSSRGTGGADLHISVGYNFKFTNIQAAVGLAQLEELTARVERQKHLQRTYARELAGLEGVKVLDFNLDRGEVPQWTDVIVERRDELVDFLEQRQMHCRKFWHALHTQSPYHADPNRFPVSSKLVPKALWLPSAFTLSEEEALEVSAAIREFVRGKSGAAPETKKPEQPAGPAPLTRGQPRKLSILLPVRNEGINLQIMLKLLRAVVNVPHEVLVVHDFEQDDSIPTVRAMQNIYSDLRLVHNKIGPGVVNAIRAGVAAAYGDAILIFAADEVGPVLAIDDMLALMADGCDFVSCTRYAHGGRRLGGSIIGGVLSRLANKLFHRFSRCALTDATTGIKMFSRPAFERLALEARPIGWAVAFEMSVKAQLAGLQLGEVPIISIDRLYGGQSTFRLGPWTYEYLRWFVWGAKRLRKAAREHPSHVQVRIPATTVTR